MPYRGGMLHVVMRVTFCSGTVSLGVRATQSPQAMLAKPRS